MKFLKSHRVLSASAVLSLFYLVIFTVKRNVSPSPIIFYEGLFIAGGIVIFFLFVVAILVVLKKAPYSPEYLNIAVLTIFMTYSFHITVPTLLERSISIFAIGFVAQKEEGVDKNDLNEAFLRLYIKGDETINKRIDEQITTGNFVLENNKLRITDKGTRHFKLNRFLSILFNISDEHIAPTETIPE